MTRAVNLFTAWPNEDWGIGEEEWGIGMGNRNGEQEWGTGMGNRNGERGTGNGESLKWMIW